MTAHTAGSDPMRATVRRIDAVFGGPVWWGTHLGITYWLVPRACAWGAEWPLHLATVVLVALCARAGLSGVQVWRAAAGADDPAAGRDVFLGRFGLALAVFFGAVTLAEGVPAMVMGPCT